MKKLIIFAFLLSSCFFSFSEKKVWKDPNAKELMPLDANGKIVYTEVVEMPNVIKDALYSRAYEWFAKSFKDAKNVIQMQDKDAGKIIGKGIFDGINVKCCMGLSSVIGYVQFTLSIYLKDGKYKYEITDFVHEGHWSSNASIQVNGGSLDNEKPESGKSYLTQKKWKEVKELTNERVLLFIESLIKAMTVETAGDNW